MKRIIDDTEEIHEEVLSSKKRGRLEDAVVMGTDNMIYSGGGFDQLVKESTIFVDKTLFIKEIINIKKNVVLITMPRRWGKSCNLDMLNRFLSIEVDRETGSVIPHTQTDNYKLFAGGDINLHGRNIKNLEKLKIGSDDYCMELQGQYPVIFIDL